MNDVNIAIVGCAGKGRRHLTGLAELAQSDFASVQLQAVCDLNERNAEDLADEAVTLLGSRPRIVDPARRRCVKVRIWRGRT